MKIFTQKDLGDLGPMTLSKGFHLTYQVLIQADRLHALEFDGK